MTQLRQILISLALLLSGIALGWNLHAKQTSATPPTCLRLSGFELTQPLLSCDVSDTNNSPGLSKVESEIENITDAATRAGSISVASVYVRDLVNRQELTINGEETFFPASLKKVPLMMQYYKEAETNPSILTEQITITESKDYNEGTVFRPKDFPVFGKSYSTVELMNYMILYSDNISFQYLLRKLGYEKFNKVYEDLELHYPDNIVTIDDYMTPKQFSLFFRTLFNATYLNTANSEAALSLLSDATYDRGLVAGVPESITVSHKFGVGVVKQDDGTEIGELHDCGIIYHPERPYLLCVMTKSSSLSIADVETVIADISRAVYENIYK